MIGFWHEEIKQSLQNIFSKYKHTTTKYDEINRDP